MHETHCCKNTMGLVQNNTELSRNQQTTSRQMQFTGPGYKRATRALQNRCTALCRNAIFLESSVGLSVEWVRKPSRVENQGGGGGGRPGFSSPEPVCDSVSTRSATCKDWEWTPTVPPPTPPSYSAYLQRYTTPTMKFIVAIR